MEQLNPTFARWCLMMWERLKDDTIWCIPRSSTVFQRRGDQLVFIEGSEREFRMVRDHFAEIGVEVVKGPVETERAGC